MSDTATLDELVERAGITRDEWQRAREVVQDYWMDFARINGWAPNEQGVPRRTFRFPLYPAGEFTVSAPLTESQWDVLMSVLTAAKPGLIEASNQERSAE